MGRQNGGAAFPSSGIVISQGMSLRDYFAAKAMQGAIASMDSGERNYTDSNAIAERAYLIADAMLAERAK